MFKTENIGPDHDNFNHSFGSFTQVLVIHVETNTVIAQFFGLQAKILANKFVANFNKR
jgi:hypothetical protein